jgi:hypothetical protein
MLVGVYEVDEGLVDGVERGRDASPRVEVPGQRQR